MGGYYEIFRNRLVKNKAFRWPIYYAMCLGSGDAWLNVDEEYGIPVCMLFGALITPVVGVIGLIYEKIKNDESILFTLVVGIITVCLCIPVYMASLGVFLGNI